MEQQQPTTSLQRSPLAGVSLAQLFALAQQNDFENAIMQEVTNLGRKAVDDTVLLGLRAYRPELASLGIEEVRADLSNEPGPVEGLELIRYKPTGEAFMVIGEPHWPAGEYTDLSKLRVEVPYDLIAAEDRKYFERRNG